ncbi:MULTISPECIES: hypothetical protein [Vibrio]|uniref:hypothetical protein n=1 Tax=Vibrio TaxID=662 RepID=UPI00078E86C2|nr:MULTISPECIES: hypothetical protein [Vibrio]BAU70841.1 hypothetical protein [Vibrio sp. 04Ya108]BBM67590.1 hypothetical protein VA249_42360 [Vibrio alfacsensis]BCN27073.1 hypothetical protein VYA_42650 [Vibrio alfacsensis]
MSIHNLQYLREANWKKQLEADFEAGKAKQVSSEQREAIQAELFTEMLIEQQVAAGRQQREDTITMFCVFFVVIVLVSTFLLRLKAKSTVQREHDLAVAKERFHLREDMEREKTSMHKEMEAHKTSVNKDVQREITSMHKELEREKTANHKKSCEDRLAVAIKMERQILELILANKMTAEEAEAYIAADYQYSSVKDDLDIRSDAAAKVTEAMATLNPDLTEADLAKVKTYKPQPVMERMTNPVMDESDEPTSQDVKVDGFASTGKLQKVNKELVSHFANRRSAEA